MKILYIFSSTKITRYYGFYIFLKKTEKKRKNIW